MHASATGPIKFYIEFGRTQERKKDLLDHRDDSTFSFDPTTLKVKKLNKNYKKNIDQRKGILLAQYSRKKTRKRKKGRDVGSGKAQVNLITNPFALCSGARKKSDFSVCSLSSFCLLSISRFNLLVSLRELMQQSRSVTPSPNMSQRQTAARPQALAVQRTRAITFQTAPPNPNVLHPLGTYAMANICIAIKTGEHYKIFRDVLELFHPITFVRLFSFLQ